MKKRQDVVSSEKIIDLLTTYSNYRETEEAKDGTGIINYEVISHGRAIQFADELISLALSASPAGVVKPLEWTETEYISTDDDGGPMEGIPVKLKAWRSGPYLIIRQRSHDGLFLLRGKSDGVGLATPYLEAAKSAAFADYSARIMSAIEPAGVGVETPPPSTHVVCPCTLIEQDEDCPVGYPSLLCGVCDGKGHTTQEQLRALACEMIKIASDIGGPEDPFAAWESIDLIKSQHERMRKALAPFAEVADRFDGVPVSAILPQQCWFTPHSLREARAALATTEGKDNG